LNLNLAHIIEVNPAITFEVNPADALTVIPANGTKVNLDELNVHLANDLTLNLATTFEVNPADVLNASPVNELDVNPADAFTVNLTHGLNVNLAHALKVNLHQASNELTSCFHTRDRDITADPLLEGISDVDLAGQASPGSNNRHSKSNPSSARYHHDDNHFGIFHYEIIGIYDRTMQSIANKTHTVEIKLDEAPRVNEPQQEFLHQLQRIIDDENAELRAMKMHLDNASDIILMLQASSQTDPCVRLMRIIDDDIEHQQEKKQKLGQDDNDHCDLEQEQMLDDIEHEEDAATNRIIESFGGLFHDGGSDSDDTDRAYEINSEFYVHSVNSSEDDINENTDTEDGGDELLDLLDANTKLINFIARQRDTLDRLRCRITRMKRYIERLTFRMNVLTAQLHPASNTTDSPDTASVLMNDEIDASLLVKPDGALKVEFDIFSNA
jgi:hypothetical protein